MAVSEAHKRASNKWNASRDNIMIRPDKETGAAIRAAADSAGKSVQAFVLEAVAAYMERQAMPGVVSISGGAPDFKNSGSRSI